MYTLIMDGTFMDSHLDGPMWWVVIPAVKRQVIFVYCFSDGQVFYNMY